VATDRSTPLVAATCRPPSTRPTRLELRRVWLGAALEGIDVGDAGDIGDGQGGMVPLRQRPPLPPPTVLPGKVTMRRPARRTIYGSSLSSIRCCSHHARTPCMPHAKSRRTRCWRRLQSRSQPPVRAHAPLRQWSPAPVQLAANSAALTTS
jgi:hypothetical protein